MYLLLRLKAKGVQVQFPAKSCVQWRNGFGLFRLTGFSVGSGAHCTCTSEEEDESVHLCELCQD